VEHLTKVSINNANLRASRLNVPPLIALRPRQLRLERREHVEKSPSDYHVVVNTD